MRNLGTRHALIELGSESIPNLRAVHVSVISRSLSVMCTKIHYDIDSKEGAWSAWFLTLTHSVIQCRIVPATGGVQIDAKVGAD